MQKSWGLDVSTEGSWEAGSQEFQTGVAEDRGQITRTVVGEEDDAKLVSVTP